MHPGQPSATGARSTGEPVWPGVEPHARSAPTTGRPPAPACPAPVSTVDRAVRAEGGPDGDAVAGEAGGHLDYLSRLAKQLGVADPVESYVTPLLGRWSDLHDEAARWRTAGQAAAEVTRQLTSPLGGLDAAWQGQDANSFLDYMQRIGLAGTDLSDAMNAMGDALDRTADGLRQIVRELVDMLADTAEQASDAMSVPVSGESRARKYLDEVDRPGGQLYESVRDVLEAFVKLCEGVPDGQSFGSITMAHTVPAVNWSPTGAKPKPAPPTAIPHQTPPANGVPHQIPPATGVPSQAPPATGTPPFPPVPAPTHTAGAAPLAASATSPSGASGIGHPGGGHAAGLTAAHLGGGVPTPASDLAAQHSGPPPQSLADPMGGASAHGGGAMPSGVGGPAAADPNQSGGGMAIGGMGMGGMRGGQGGGEQEHKSKLRAQGDIAEIFGRPERTTPPTIGES